MYKRVESDLVAVFENGEEFKPVATLADEHGGRCQVSVDDGCYVVSLRQPSGRYKITSWLFPEVLAVLKELPMIG